MKKLIIAILSIPLKIFTKVSIFSVIYKSHVHKNSAILSGTRFYDSEINNYSYIGRNCLIVSTKIGKYCSISDNCNIGLAKHHIDWVSTSPIFNGERNIFKDNYSNKKYQPYSNTIIGNDVWIGINALIKTGITIGDGAIIGAGSIVTKDVPPYAIVAGNPAKIIRYRFTEEQIKNLLKMKWWDLEQSILRTNAQYCDNIDEFIIRCGKEQ